MTAAEPTAATEATFSPPATIQRSPWHSTVPYLFGGLAAMLGLIAFALVILTCSYWKTSGGEEGGERDLESGDAEKGDSSSAAKASPVFAEKYLVIMAGDVKPTYLATPMSGRSTTSFGDEEAASRENNEEEKIKQKDETTKGNEGESRVNREQIH